MWKGRGKGRKWSPKGSQKSTRSMKKTMPEIGRKTLKKISRGAEALRRTNRGKHIIRATPPTNSYMVALIVFFFCDSHLPKEGKLLLSKRPRNNKVPSWYKEFNVEIDEIRWLKRDHQNSERSRITCGKKSRNVSNELCWNTKHFITFRRLWTSIENQRFGHPFWLHSEFLVTF